MYMQRAETRTNVDANNSLKDNRESWKPDWSKSSWRVTEIGGGVCLSHTKQQKQLSKVIINW